MTSELSKYLNEQVGVFLNVKQQKRSWLKTEKKEFLSENTFYNAIFNQILCQAWKPRFFENIILSSKKTLTISLKPPVLNW